MIGTRVEIITKIRKLQKQERSARARAFSRFGAFVMTRARRSIRTAKSPQFGPTAKPRNRTGLLKKNIFFMYDETAGDVVIGPAFLGKRVNSAELHEHGGRNKLTGKLYQPRAYMRPAFETELAQSARKILGGYLTK